MSRQPNARRRHRPHTSKIRAGISKIVPTSDVRHTRIDSSVKIDGQKVGSVDVDPFIYSLNLAYRF